MHRVVVTGYGLVTPLGFNTEDVWKKICHGVSGIRRTTTPHMDGMKSLITGECRDFSTEGYIPLHDARRLERFVQYALVASIEAVRQSGLDFSNFSAESRDRCAVVIGSGVGGLSEIENQHLRLIQKGPSKVSPFTIPKIMPNSAAGNVSIYYGLTGPSYAVATACATSINALTDAMKMIRYGEMDIVLAGGSEAAATSLGLAGFNAMRALSERNDEPERASRPFDRDRDGFVLSDGCGILVLESLEHAQKRRAEILGEVLGTGLTSDGTHITQPDEDGTGAMKAILKSLSDARIDRSEIDYINAHGTATILGDIAETRAIKRSFGDWAYKIPISSTKSQIGHLLGGSGAVETIFCLQSIRDGIIPPTINLENPDPQCDLDFTPLAARECRISTVLSNSFGFGGHNACIIVSRLR
ncbi:MAG: beta-ketoacyl-ACP synthase II [Planctomycetaceae bacterium]|jgi:3-oxoacyl-[acyl-carrier-protein] synthase II|nr:beta-ketoacyl-ACP synthase II [Planctomycetaceae bacterium]